MPSPAGHAIAGLALKWAAEAAAGRPLDSPPAAARLAGARRWAIRFSPLGIACLLAATAPDLDFLFGSHRTYTHSVGAAAIAGGLAAVWAWRTRRSVALVALLCAAACASHAALDWLGADLSKPPGVMALWPFSSAHLNSGVGLFPVPEWHLWPIDRFILANLRYVLIEQLMILPVAGMVGLLRAARLRSSGTPRAAGQTDGVGTDSSLRRAASPDPA